MKFANLAPPAWKLHDLPAADPSLCKIPVTCIKPSGGNSDLTQFHASPAFQRITSFIYALNVACAGSPNSSVDGAASSVAVVNDLLEVLNQVESWALDIPPEEGQQRFGNRAFREWHSRLEQVRP